MPLRWYGNGDPNDPIYLHFSRIVNFTIHTAAFAALNSFLWFVQQLRHPWGHLSTFSEVWLVLLLSHLLFVIVRRPNDAKQLEVEKE